MELEDFKLIENSILKDELVVLSKKTLINAIYSSTLIDCDIVLEPKGMPSARFGSRFDIVRDELERCVIRAMGRVHKLNVAETVIFKHCKFIGGPFTEPVFGSGVLSDSTGVELLEMCDFTECDLRDARFYSTSIKQLKLPGWPHIAVIARDGDQLYTAASRVYSAYSQLHDEVSEFDWVDRDMAKGLATMVFAVRDGRYAPNIEVCHAEDVIKRGGGTLELLKSELDRFNHPAIRY